MRSLRKKSSLFGGALSMTLSAISVKIIGVFYKIPLSYMLGESGMGYFNTAYAVYAIFYVISSAGIPKAVTMEIAVRDGEDSESDLRNLCRSILRVFGALGLLITLIFLLLTKPLAVLLGSGAASVTMLAIAPSILFATLAGVMRGYLNGRARLFVIAVSQLIEALSKLILGLLFAYVGIAVKMPIPAIAAFSVTGITIGALFSCIYMYYTAFGRNMRDKTKKTTPKRNKVIIKRIFSRSLPITASAAIISVSGVLDLSLVMRGLKHIGYSEEAANAIYGNYSTLAMPLINLIVSLLAPISMAMLPEFVKKKNDPNGFSKSFRRAAMIIAFISAPCAVMYALYAFDLLDILFASAPAANGAPSLICLSFAVIILPLLNLANTALEARDKTYRALISLVIGLGIKLILCAVCIFNNTFSIQIIALSTALSYGVSLMFSLISLRLPSRKNEPGGVASALFLSIITFIPWYIGFYSVNPMKNGFVNILLSMSVPGILYASAAALLYFKKELMWFRSNIAQKNHRGNNLTSKKL